MFRIERQRVEMASDETFVTPEFLILDIMQECRKRQSETVDRLSFGEMHRQTADAVEMSHVMPGMVSGMELRHVPLGLEHRWMTHQISIVVFGSIKRPR